MRNRCGGDTFEPVWRLWQPGVLAVVLPTTAGFALYAVLFGAYGVDDCGPSGIPRVLINAPFLILPPVLVWLRARATGRVWSEQIFFVLVAAALAYVVDYAIWSAWHLASTCFN